MNATMTPKQVAKLENAYLSRHAYAVMLAEEIAESLGDMPNCEDATWGLVGNLEELIKRLKEAKGFVAN